MPQISVIVPVYKVEPYLRQCVDSILAQTFPDYELILVDDGSPDNCGAICDEYAANDCRIHVIHQSNGGLSAARNAALDWMFANSPSPYLTFIDSDDWVHEQYLEYLYKEINKSEYSIVACDFACFSNSDVEPLPDPKWYKVVDMPTESFWCEKWRCAVSACYKLFSKRLFHDLRFPVGRIYEDQMLMPSVLFQVPLVRYVDARLYCYRQRNGSIMHQDWSPAQLDYCNAMENQMEFFTKLGLVAARKVVVERYLQEMALCHIHAKQKPELGSTFTSNLRKRARCIWKEYGKDVHLPLCAENYAVFSLLHPVFFPDFLRKIYHLVH